LPQGRDFAGKTTFVITPRKCVITKSDAIRLACFFPASDNVEGVAGEAILLILPCNAPDADLDKIMTQMKMTFDTVMMRSV